MAVNCFRRRCPEPRREAGGCRMGLYIMLSTLSESGRKVLRERPGWIKRVNAGVQRMGARVVAQYAVLGPYDFVTVIDAPSNAAISRISVELGARGGVQGMTMAAIPLDQFIDGLQTNGSRKRTPRTKRGDGDPDRPAHPRPQYPPHAAYWLSPLLDSVVV